jgi:hypothetical protein
MGQEKLYTLTILLCFNEKVSVGEMVMVYENKGVIVKVDKERTPEGYWQAHCQFSVSEIIPLLAATDTRTISEALH